MKESHLIFTLGHDLAKFPGCLKLWVVLPRLYESFGNLARRSRPFKCMKQYHIKNFYQKIALKTATNFKPELLCLCIYFSRAHLH